MKNILIISGHPRLSHSYANRLIIEELASDKNVLISDIMMNYPDYIIDVHAEQQKLAVADLIILQTPIIWYGVPAHVKLWIEQVFTEGFAYGKQHTVLKGKIFLLSVTAGGSEQAYSSGGQHGYLLDQFLLPLQSSIKYCGMECRLPLISYSMSAGGNITEKMVEDRAKLHAHVLKGMIKMFSGIRTFAE